MAKSGDKAWRLDRREVAVGWSRHSSGRGGRPTKRSRALGIQSERVTVRHRPTGLEVSGEIEAGHYTRTELRHRREALVAQLIAQLEPQVAKALRISGR